MEKGFNDVSYKFIMDDELNCQNIRQISMQIKQIKKKFFENTKDFSIKIYFSKKISKNLTLVNLLINRFVFELKFDFSSLSPQTRKEQRKNFASNLLDEVVDIFPAFSSLRFLSDNLNLLRTYTFKSLIKEKDKVRVLELYNTVITFDKDCNDLLKQLSEFKCLEKLTLSFSFETLDCKGLFELMDSFFTKTSIKKTNLQVIFKNIDIMSFLDKSLLNNKRGTLINNINELNLNLIKYDPEKSILISDKHRGLIVPIFLLVMNKYWPSYFDFNYYEIVKVESNHIFKKINIKYTKDFFFSLNLIKDFVLAKYTKKTFDSRLFNIFSSYSQLSFPNDKMFKPSFVNLGLSLSDLKQMNLLKWMYDFIQELEGYTKRKQTTDDIMHFLNNRPIDTEMISSPLINLKENDLAFVSKILNRIEGFQKVCLKNGDVMIIGGRIKLFFENKETLFALNTIIKTNIHYSAIKIYCYRDNYFIPHFNANAGLWIDNKIIVVGGISVPSLLENFKYTPIFIVNLNDFTVTRILPENSIFYPGILFNHKMLLTNEKLIISEGFTITNVDQLNVLKDKEKSKSDVERNSSIFEFNFEKKSWKLSLNSFKI